MYAISRKTNKPNLRKWKKQGYHGQLSSCTISEKTNDSILRKLCDRQTDGLIDGRSDRWTKGLEWFHRSLCN